jgi:Tol biopolymer transport system component
MMRRMSALLTLVVAAALCCASPAAAGAAAPTKRVSVSSTGAQAFAGSGEVSISANGRFVVFQSAWPFVANDTNGLSDIYVHDRKTRITRRVSVATGGAQADGDSVDAEISGNGRFVVFVSYAKNLVPLDENNAEDVFIRDRKTKTTRRVSVSSAGEEADEYSARPSVSSDGRFVAFASYATNLGGPVVSSQQNVYVRDRKLKTTRRVSLGLGGAAPDGDSTLCAGYAPAISADGTFVAFASKATNLVTGDSGPKQDVFVRNRKTGVTRRVSVSSAGAEADQGASSYCAISGSGTLVVYESNSKNLVPSDTNDETDVFVRNWRTRKTTRVNVTSKGAQSTTWNGYAGISGNGRFVYFQGPDSNLASRDKNGFDDIYVHDRKTKTTRRVTPGQTAGPNGNGYGWMSADGRFLAFESDALIVQGDTNGLVDVFVRGPFRWPR